MSHPRPGLFPFVVLLFVVCGCGGDQKKTVPASRDADPAAFAAALDSGPRAAETLTLDSALADRGAILFDTLSCSDCHTLGESDLAPDLRTVLDQRTVSWLKLQITDPEWMNTHDPIAQALIEEYDLEMVDMGASEGDAEAILHFLLREQEPVSPSE